MACLDWDFDGKMCVLKWLKKFIFEKKMCIMKWIAKDYIVLKSFRKLAKIYNFQEKYVFLDGLQNFLIFMKYLCK